MGGVMPFPGRVYRRMMCNDFMQLYEGPVRSGKTVSSLLSWMLYINSKPVSTVMMSGNTVGSLIRNCIKGRFGLLALWPGAQMTNSASIPQLKVPTPHGTVTIYLFGGGKANSEDSLRGLTIDGWYADEITKHHKGFVSEALARSAASDCPCNIWTSNPDNPRHWLYREYTDKWLAMDDVGKRELGGYHEFHFTLEDNPALTPDKIASMRRRYVGHDYDRKILGKRCIAEGLVYPCFGGACIGDMPPDTEVRWCAIDFGEVHPTAMVWIGRHRPSSTWWVAREWMSAKPDEQGYIPRTMAEIADVFEQISSGYQMDRMGVTVDPGGGGKALTVELQRRRWMVQTPDKAVLEGIAYTAALLNTGKLKIDRSCVRLIDQMAQYHWDDSASETGETRPWALDDDLPDAVRYGAMTHIKPRQHGRMAV